MSRRSKLIKKLKSKPRDFEYDEVETLLELLGYKKIKGSKTGGSRVKYYKGKKIINLHRPHPRNTLLPYQVNHLLSKLEKEEDFEWTMLWNIKTI